MQDQGITPKTDPHLFDAAGHAPYYFLYRAFERPGSTVVVSILEAARGCDPEQILPADAVYDLCPVKITVTRDGRTSTIQGPLSCYYDESEDEEYKSRIGPNASFAKLEGSILQLGVWALGKHLPECDRTIKLP
jgi:hypothetical protein